MTTEQLELNLSRTHEWIRAADQKASIFLALVLGVLALGGEGFVNFIAARFRFEPVWVITLLAVSNIILIWSITKALLIIKPSLSNNAKSFTYFGHIGQLSLGKYRTLVASVDNKKYKDELIEQIHTSSVIARRKHKQLAEAVELICGYIVALVFAIALAYVA